MIKLIVLLVVVFHNFEVNGDIVCYNGVGNGQIAEVRCPSGSQGCMTVGTGKKYKRPV
jgi:hypothetical protein